MGASSIPFLFLPNSPASHSFLPPFKSILLHRTTTTHLDPSKDKLEEAREDRSASSTYGVKLTQGENLIKRKENI